MLLYGETVGPEVSPHEKVGLSQKGQLIDVTMVLGTKDTSDAALGIQRKDIQSSKTYKCWIYIAGCARKAPMNTRYRKVR